MRRRRPRGRVPDGAEPPVRTGRVHVPAAPAPGAYEWERVVEATRRVGSRAAERGLEVAIELLPFEFAFVRTLDDMERLLDEVGLPNVDAAIDVSHLWLERIEPDALDGSRAGSPRCTSPTATARATATSRPAAARRRSPTTWRSCTSSGYRGSASVELEFPRDGQPVEAWVAEALGATRRLLAEGGQRPDLAA